MILVTGGLHERILNAANTCSLITTAVLFLLAFSDSCRGAIDTCFREYCTTNLRLYSLSGADGAGVDMKFRN